MSHGFNHLLITLAYPIKVGHIWQNKYIVYIGLAAGGILPHVESKYGEQQREKYELHIPSGMLDLSSEYSFYKNWLILIAVKYSFACVKDAGMGLPSSFTVSITPLLSPRRFQEPFDMFHHQLHIRVIPVPLRYRQSLPHSNI